MNLKSLILLSLILASCTRDRLTYEQTRELEKQNPGCEIGTSRDSGEGPIAVVKKKDGSVWIYVFQSRGFLSPLIEEEVIPASSP